VTGFLLTSLPMLTIFAWYWRVARRPELMYADSEFSRQLLSAVPRLTRRYMPTPWLVNAHLQILAIDLKKRMTSSAQYDHSQLLTMRDGGTTGLYWMGHDLPADTPTLLVFHTITGSAESMRDTMSELLEASGWRVVLCLRRGHGKLPLTAPRFNTLGDTDDLREQIGEIRAQFPESPLYALGISAGSGLLVRYLGEEGEHSAIRGGMAYCPGYNIEVAFTRALPFYSKLMAKRLVKQFISPNQKFFADLKSYRRGVEAVDLHDLHDHLYEFAGFSSREDYMNASNPMHVIKNIKVPLLVLNAEDDPICSIENVRENAGLVQSQPNIMLAVTARGSHCAHFEGMRMRSWGSLLAAEYFVALDAQQGMEPEAEPMPVAC
tara:strand:+ start:37038 stop:38171 length:1134 start_codon:yes stop_codon:yes gene_type:complete